MFRNRVTLKKLLSLKNVEHFWKVSSESFPNKIGNITHYRHPNTQRWSTASIVCFFEYSSVPVVIYVCTCQQLENTREYRINSKEAESLEGSLPCTHGFVGPEPYAQWQESSSHPCTLTISDVPCHYCTLPFTDRNCSNLSEKQ